MSNDKKINLKVNKRKLLKVVNVKEKVVNKIRQELSYVYE